MDALVPLLIGLVSTLTTLVLTPRLQHRFWGYQRMSEARLRAFEKVNSLAAEFLQNHLKDEAFRPDDQFFRSLMVTTAEIKILFSPMAFDRFKKLEVMIGPNLGPTGKGNVEVFIEARDVALRALYSEAVAARLF
jgi:hypothetical protein